MKKVYRLSKAISEAEAEEILRELRELDYVKEAEFLEERAYLRVAADDADFSRAMDRAVNICRRIAGGCEMSYAWYNANT